jgi:hypothetical protein
MATVDALCKQLAHGALIRSNDDVPSYPKLPTRILNGFCWRIDEPVTDDEDSRPYLDTEFMDGYNVRSVLIELNIGQWKERERLGIVEVEVPCTPRRVMDAIFAFYQRPLDAEFLSAIRASSKKVGDDGSMVSDDEDDTFCAYAADLLANKTSDVKYHHIMGDNAFFDGLILRNTNTYAIVFE